VLPIAAFIAVDGWAGLRAAASSAVDEPYWSWLGGHGGWFALGFMLGTLSIGFGPLGQPHLLNRLMAMKSAKDIRLARTVALSWFVLVLCGMYLLGVCAHVLLTTQVESEQVFFVMADQLLPAVFTGVLIASVLSAIMSTADSQLLVAGAAIHHDLQRAKGVAPYATKGSAQGAVKNAARFAVFAVALAAVLLASLLPSML